MKYMATGTIRGRPSSVSIEVVFDVDVFEGVQEFVYLGTFVTPLKLQSYFSELNRICCRFYFTMESVVFATKLISVYG